jgi:transcriptional regulator with XRE-family HTH domain
LGHTGILKAGYGTEGKEQYMREYTNFGDYLSAKRRQRGISSLAMSEKIGISPGYYCDIEKSRKKPPEREILDKILKWLGLSEEDKLTFFDLAGKARSSVSPDLPEYIMENKVVLVALRLAKDKADAEDWNEFINKLKNKD